MATTNNIETQTDNYDLKIIYAVLIFFGWIFTAAFASYVGASRADAVKECYKAAQVNHNIKCEIESDR